MDNRQSLDGVRHVFDEISDKELEWVIKYVTRDCSWNTIERESLSGVRCVRCRIRKVGGE